MKETKTEAIRRALLERRARLAIRRSGVSKKARLETLLKNRVWPLIPANVRGKRLTKKAKEAILGYGPEGF
jgi:antitoxin VapB